MLLYPDIRGHSIGRIEVLTLSQVRVQLYSIYVVLLHSIKPQNSPPANPLFHQPVSFFYPLYMYDPAPSARIS